MKIINNTKADILSFREFSKINRDSYGYMTSFDEVASSETSVSFFLGEKRSNYIKNPSGQTGQACNSRVRDIFRNHQSANVITKANGILIYLPLDVVKYRLKTKATADIIQKVKIYIEELMNTEVFSGLKYEEIRRIDNSVSLKKSLPDDILRKEEIIKLATNSANGDALVNCGANPLSEDDDAICISLTFSKKIISTSHALAHVMAIRYLFYYRYECIVNAFLDIRKKCKSIGALNAFTVAHHFAKANRYTGYFGVFDKARSLSYPNKEGIVERFKGGKNVNYSFYTKPPARKMKVNPINGVPYSTINSGSVTFNRGYYDAIKNKDYIYINKYLKKRLNGED